MADNKLDFKLLKKLAKECRRAGIKSFKGFGMEFTLDERSAETSTKKSSKKGKSVDNSDTSEEKEIGNLTDEQLLYYSVSDPSEDFSKETQ